MPSATHTTSRAEALAWRIALAATLTLPLALLHARALAEILIAAIDILFLLRTALTRNTAWLRQSFTLAAIAWWLWLSLCSALGTGGLLMALLAIRLPVLALALSEWVLAGPTERDSARRHVAWAMLAASAAWIALQSWEQYLLGTNLFGIPRYPDGALTGPFNKPRAGPAYILLFFPALLPAIASLARRPNLAPRAAGVALAIAAALTMVMIGQRMPTALMVLGLAAAALLVPGLRVAALCAVLAGAALLAALPWASPAAAAKLIAQTTTQMAHFPQSDYGQIFTRAITSAELHPWLGLGFDGFRRGCADPHAMHGIAWLGIPDAHGNGGLAACNLHPHNYYLEALDNAGLPGLALFIAMVAAAVARLWRNKAAPAGAGMLVGALVALWPVASTSAFTSMPNGGWVFLVLGVGFSGRQASKAFFFEKKKQKTFANSPA